MREMSMRSKQRGVTLIGWILLLTPLAICGYAGIRLTPIYLNYMKVARTLEQMKTDAKQAPMNDLSTIRQALEKRLLIEQVEFPDAKDFKITRSGKAWIIDAGYDDQAPLFSNVFILVTFDKTVTLGSEGGE
jgi:Domain of unknown function (DUF4845)